MRPIQLSSDVVSVGEFKLQAANILARVKTNRRPIVITQHGKPAAVLVSPEDYDALAEHARFLESVQQGMNDSECGRLVEDSELDDELAHIVKISSGR